MGVEIIPYRNRGLTIKSEHEAPTRRKDKVDPGPVHGQSIKEKHLPIILDWFQHEDVGRYLKAVPHTVDDLRDYYADDSLEGFMVFNKESVPVGVFGLRELADIDEGKVE